MNIEEDIKNLKTYIELVIEKNYCDCNELNTICYGKYGDGSKNVAKSIETLLTAYEKEKETSHYIQSQLDIANAKLVEEKEKNKKAIDFINERKKTVNKDMAEGTRLQVGTFMWQVDELLEILKEE